MKPFLFSLAAISCAASLSAQTYLSEDFSAPTLPAGWTEIQNGPNLNGWAIETFRERLWHEDFTGSTTDNYLVSPVMDLSAAVDVVLSFQTEVHYANYLANHPNSQGDGVSTIEVTTDGGSNWTVVWTDTSLEDQVNFTPSVDLSAFAGQASVQIGIHFYGTYSQEWYVDNVRVKEGTPGPQLHATNLHRGGSSTLSVTGATPGGSVMLAYSLAGDGPTGTVFGLADLSHPIHTVDVVTADATGLAQGTYAVPLNWGYGLRVHAQAVDLSTSTLSTSLDTQVY